MEMEKKVLELNLDDILPNRFQPRIKFDEEAIKELSDSIKEHGVIQPIIVRKIGDKYEIIAGERRYKASVIAGKTTIPAIITDLNDQQSAEIALIENVQRQDLTPIEEAISYRKILDMGNLTQEDLAGKLDRNQSTISNKLRLLNLDDEVQEALLNEKISERHARSLLKINDKNQQREMLKRIINERLTVRKTDDAIDNLLNNKKEDIKPPVESTVLNVEEEAMNNNANNDIFNIPSEPIVEDVEIKTDDIEIPIDNNDINEEQPNPGFMDIDKIEKQAQDIYVEKPTADIDNLLESNKPNIPLAETEIKTEEGTNDDYILRPGKFFSMENEIHEQPTPPAPNTDVFTSTSFSNDEFNIVEEKKDDIDAPQTNEEHKNNDSNKEASINPIFDDPFNFTPSETLINKKDEKIEEPEEINFEDESITSSDNINDIKSDNIINDKEIDKFMFDTPVTTEPTNTYVASDLKTVINTIRNCATTIEKYGFVVDTEELDFEDTYQVIFKVQKKNNK